MLPACTPETSSDAETRVPEVETLTLSAFALTSPTLPAPVIFAFSAFTVMEPTDAPLCTVTAAAPATVMLSAVPAIETSLCTMMPLPALVFPKVTPSAPPRIRMRPVTVTFVRSACAAPSARMRSPLMVLPARDAPLLRTMTLPSTVSDRPLSANVLAMPLMTLANSARVMLLRGLSLPFAPLTKPLSISAETALFAHGETLPPSV